MTIDNALERSARVRTTWQLGLPLLTLLSIYGLWLIMHPQQVLIVVEPPVPHKKQQTQSELSVGDKLFKVAVGDVNIKQQSSPPKQNDAQNTSLQTQVTQKNKKINDTLKGAVRQVGSRVKFKLGILSNEVLIALLKRNQILFALTDNEGGLFAIGTLSASGKLSFTHHQGVIPNYFSDVAITNEIPTLRAQAAQYSLQYSKLNSHAVLYLSQALLSRLNSMVDKNNRTITPNLTANGVSWSLSP